MIGAAPNRVIVPSIVDLIHTESFVAGLFRDQALSSFGANTPPIADLAKHRRLLGAAAIFLVSISSAGRLGHFKRVGCFWAYTWVIIELGSGTCRFHFK